MGGNLSDGEAIISILLVVSEDKIVVRIEKCGRGLEMQLFLHEAAALSQ